MATERRTIEDSTIKGWTPPSPHSIKQLLDTTRSIAIVGASGNPSRASNFVITYLQGCRSDYELYPVNPTTDEINGLRCYPSLADLPVVPDMVDVFRAPADCPDVAAEAVAIGAKSLWLQLGIWSEEAAEIALDADLDLVMDKCVKIEHARFHGGLHLAGFDTGVISSRRAC